jgi:hypothetical protein
MCVCIKLNVHLKTALFWVITQESNPYGFLNLKDGTDRLPETSVRNYHHSLHNNPEERNSQLLRGGSLQSRMNVRLCISTKRYSGKMVYKTCNITCEIQELRQTQRSRGLRSKSAGFRLLGLRVRILPRAWMFVSCECRVLSGRDICDGPIPRPEKCHRVSVCVRYWVWSGATTTVYTNSE